MLWPTIFCYILEALPLLALLVNPTGGLPFLPFLPPPFPSIIFATQHNSNKTSWFSSQYYYWHLHRFVAFLQQYSQSMLTHSCHNFMHHTYVLLYCWHSHLLVELDTITNVSRATYQQMLCITTISCRMIMFLCIERYLKKSATHGPVSL
jgi:hypothetical protein